MLNRSNEIQRLIVGWLKGVVLLAVCCFFPFISGAKEKMKPWELVTNKEVYELPDSTRFKLLSAYARNYQGERQLLTRSLALSQLGTLYRENHNCSEAIPLYLKALRSQLRINHWHSAMYSCHELGACYHQLGDAKKSFRYYNYALDCARQVNDSLEMAYLNNNLAGELYFLTKYDESIGHFRHSVALFEALGLTDQVARTRLNFSAVLLNDDPDEAMELLEDCMSYADDHQEDTLFRAMCFGNIGAVWFSKGDMERAVANYQLSLALSENRKNDEINGVNYQDLSEIYQAKNEYHNALFYRLKFDSVQAKIDQQGQYEKAMRQEFNYYVSLKNEQEAKLAYQLENTQLEKRKLTYSVGLLIAVLFIAFLLTVGLIWWYRGRIKQAKQKKEMLELKNKIISSNLETALTQSAGLVEELEMRNKDLSVLEIDIDRKNQIQEKLHQGIKNLKEVMQNEGKMLTEIRELIHLSAVNIRLNGEADKKTTGRDEANHQFFEKLGEHFPKLTTNEKKLCGLIRIKTSNKEIAIIRSISPKSVEMSRYRLKKKLGLSATQSLDAFLEQF